MGRVTEDDIDEVATELIHRLNRMLYANEVRSIILYKKGKALHKALWSSAVTSGLSRAECRGIVRLFKEKPPDRQGSPSRSEGRGVGRDANSEDPRHADTGGLLLCGRAVRRPSVYKCIRGEAPTRGRGFEHLFG